MFLSTTVQRTSVSDESVTTFVLRDRKRSWSLIWEPERRVAMRRSVCEHKRATVVGSQQRVRSRRQARRGPQDCNSPASIKQEANRVAVQLQHARRNWCVRRWYLLRSNRRRLVLRPSSLGRMKNWLVLAVEHIEKTVLYCNLAYPAECQRAQAARYCGTTADTSPRARR